MSAVRLAFARLQHMVKVIFIVAGLVALFGVLCSVGVFVALAMGVAHLFASCH